MLRVQCKRLAFLLHPGTDCLQNISLQALPRSSSGGADCGTVRL
nr:MAG TPA: hypothetical protein [Caudoviricetes sp.]